MKDIKKQLADFCTELKGPLGQLPVRPVMNKFKTTFSNARAVGVTWQQMATFCHEKGIRNKRGEMISADQWRATYSNINRFKASPKRAAVIKTKAPDKYISLEEYKAPLKNTATLQSTNIRDQMKKSTAARK